MNEIQNISLLVIVMAAVLCDLQSRRIPNGIIATGLAWGLVQQLFSHGWIGIILFGGGCLIPVMVFGVLYYFRMIGAGDIKLLGVLGGFLGPYTCISITLTALLFGGLIALFLLIRGHLFVQRFYYLADYISHYSNKKEWKSYLSGVGEEARFCFSVPVLLSLLCYIGGIF